MGALGTERKRAQGKANHLILALGLVSGPGKRLKARHASNLVPTRRMLEGHRFLASCQARDGVGVAHAGFHNLVRAQSLAALGSPHSCCLMAGHGYFMAAPEAPANHLVRAEGGVHGLQLLQAMAGPGWHGVLPAGVRKEVSHSHAADGRRIGVFLVAWYRGIVAASQAPGDFIFAAGQPLFAFDDCNKAGTWHGGVVPAQPLDLCPHEVRMIESADDSPFGALMSLSSAIPVMESGRGHSHGIA